MLRQARLAGLLVVALLACASPAIAASPVADQYLSAPAPVKGATPSLSAAAVAPSAGPGASSAAGRSATAAPATNAAGARADRSRKAAAKALVVGRGEAAAKVDQPLDSSASNLPLIALGGAGLLLLALAFLAIGRARRPLATP